MSLESRLQTRLLLAAPVRLPNLRLFRRNIGEAKLKGGYTVSFGIKGQCDLYGYSRGGRPPLEIELKGVNGRLSPEQRAWASWCAEWGVPHVVLTARKEESETETVERWLTELAQLLT